MSMGRKVSMLSVGAGTLELKSTRFIKFDLDKAHLAFSIYLKSLGFIFSFFHYCGFFSFYKVWLEILNLNI